MDRQRGDFARIRPTVAHRHDEQIERAEAVHPRLHIGLDRQQRFGRAGDLVPVEPFERAGIADLGEQLTGRSAANAELLGGRPVTVAGEVAELGQHPAAQPAKQRACLGINRPGQRRIGIDRGLHRGPIAHGGMDIGKRGLQRFEQVAPLPGIDARRFDIDQRFAPAVLAQTGDCACIIALDRDNGVQQPVNREPLRGNRRRNGVDQKRHIIIDDGDAQVAPLAGRGFDLDQ